MLWAIDALYLYIDDVHGERSHDDANNFEAYSPSSFSCGSDCGFSSAKPTRPSPGVRGEVFWPDDNQIYSGSESEVNDNGKCVITYTDDGIETLNMSQEHWRIEQSPLQASSIQMAKVLESNKQETIRSIMDFLG